MSVLLPSWVRKRAETHGITDRVAAPAQFSTSSAPKVTYLGDLKVSHTRVEKFYDPHSAQRLKILKKKS